MVFLEKFINNVLRLMCLEEKQYKNILYKSIL